jgi:aspartate carbamoyltransferase catalytic subunit
MKTMRSSRDIAKEDIIWIEKRALECEEGKGKPMNGKILGILTFRPSLRTTASLKHSILKSGGNYITLDSSYVTAGEEDLDDTVKAVTDLVDILAIRTPMTVEIKDIKAEVPIINLMCGDEHTIGALWFFYSLMKRGKNLEGMKVGIYGQVRYSQPTIALCRVGAKLGMHFYEDSIVDEIGSDETLRNEVNELGGSWNKLPLDEFIDKVDLMWVSDGRPGEGAKKEIIDLFLSKYRVMGLDDMKKTNPECFWYIDEPRMLPDGRLTISKETDNHPMLLNEAMMKESRYVNQAVFEWLLEK